MLKYLALVPLTLAGCLSQTTMGTGGGPAAGSASLQGAADAPADLQRCDWPLGTMALIESNIPGLAQYGLTSPLPVLRLIAQQSGCFVVERDQAFAAMMRERDLARSGEMRSGSSFGGEQMVAADLSMTPNIIFSGNTGGSRGRLSGWDLLPGSAGAMASSIAGSVKFTSAEAVLNLVDNRSGLQVAAAEGSATARDIDLGGSLFGWGAAVGGAAGLGAYGKTPEGKVVTAALMDAFNNAVIAVRGMPPLPSAAQLVR